MKSQIRLAVCKRSRLRRNYCDGEQASVPDILVYIEQVALFSCPNYTLDDYEAQFLTQHSTSN
jgi:hypothetical protein